MVKTDLPCPESDLQPSQHCALIHTTRFTDFQSFEQPATTQHPQPLLTWLPQTHWGVFNLAASGKFYPKTSPRVQFS